MNVEKKIMWQEIVTVIGDGEKGRQKRNKGG